ncbi:MAG: pilus assembly protein TadG-related protein [Pseudomonadota bacterium]
MRRLLRHFFLEDERGALSPMFLALLLGLVLLTGLSLDMVRQEAARADLQNAMDRGVLAAADLEQTIDPETTVTDYVGTRLLSDEPVQLAVTSDQALNYRQVSASATYEQDTIFLNMWGDSSLPVVGSSAAMERRDDVEISLILDISGSMARERSSGTELSRLEVLKDAAKEFVSLVLVTGTTDTTSVSLVPYSGQVNAGVMYTYLRSSNKGAQYGKCIAFDDTDFTVSGFPEYRSRPQAQQFQNFRFEADYGHDAEWGWCPYNDQAVRPFLNRVGTLNAAIERFSGHDGTGSQIGMKWGLALLDPATQPWTKLMVDNGKVPEVFADRPALYNSENVLKVIVLMTDGNTRYQPQVKSEYYDSECERDILANLDGNTANFKKKISSNVNFEDCGGSSSVNVSTLQTSSARTTDENLRREQLRGLCDIARENDIVVFTIGFDISEGSNAYYDMQHCASSESQFYFVEGLQLSTAFTQIAATISKLKLVE